jgi:hypothetical protein
MTTLNERVLAQLAFEDPTIGIFYGNIDQLVDDAIAKVATFIYANFPTSKDLYDYWASAGNHLSLDRIETWPSDRDDVDAMTTLEALEYMLGDTLPYLIAHGLLGSGVGLWEMFDQDFPQLNTLV